MTLEQAIASLPEPERNARAFVLAFVHSSGDIELVSCGSAAEVLMLATECVEFARERNGDARTAGHLKRAGRLN